MRHSRWLLPLVGLLASCGGSTSTGGTSALAVPSTVSRAGFSEAVQTSCAVIDDRAYRDVQKVFPQGAEATPERRAAEARIRAQATDQLVAELRRLTPSVDVVDRWDSIIAGLVVYAEHERSLATAIEAGTPEPGRPAGLENFRELGLGGRCDDWLDMN